MNTDDLIAFTPDEQVTFLTEQFREANPARADELAPWLQRQLRIFKQRVRAVRSYKMKPYDWPITLLRASEGEPDESRVASANDRPEDETFG